MPTISPVALHQLQRLYQKSGRVEKDEYEDEGDEVAAATAAASDSVEIDSNESTPVVKVLAITTPESLSHHLPSAALAILRGNNLQQQRKTPPPHRTKDKIDSITKDLSNVDLD